MVFLLLPWTDTRLSTWQEEDKWSFSSCRGQTHVSPPGRRKINGLSPPAVERRISASPWQEEDKSFSSHGRRTIKRLFPPGRERTEIRLSPPAVGR